MKFKNRTSRILACSLLLSTCVSCIAKCVENNMDKNNMDKNYKEGELSDNHIDTRDRMGLVPYDISGDKKENLECYICQTKDNPWINYVLGKNRPTATIEKDSKILQCINCGCFMHDECWTKFCILAPEKYSHQLDPKMKKVLDNGYKLICPCCLYNKSPLSKNNNEKDVKNENLENNVGKDNNENMVMIKKQHLLYGGGLIAILALLKNNRVDVHIHQQA